MSLTQVIESLLHHRRELDTPYYVPGLWVDFQTEAARKVNPYDFFAERLQAIQDSPTSPLVSDPHGSDWTRYATTYNLFPRLTTAFDHNGMNGLERGTTSSGWRETGTLLKCIAILPYIASLGFNTVHLLPITTIGEDGRKGTLGSPYAIRNPYHLDENLGEPALSDISVDMLFKAFVEAAHQLGLRVIMEFVLRTASKDADWVKEHPEWFYWVREDVRFGPPMWDWDTMNRIYQRVGRNDMHDLPRPSESYRRLFTAPPTPENIVMEKGRWVGTLEDGTQVRVPGAFTDWPLDGNQPLWSDVTYLRLYDHPDFNYMAYNTLRMYDNRLAQSEHIVEPLWEAIVGVLPHYQETCGIDGAMIDMGHALPPELKRRMMARTREINPEFAFWAEDFNVSQHMREEGYNAVMGHLIFDMHQPEKMQGYIERLSRWCLPITVFNTPENHNTPRAGIRDNALGFCHQVLLYMVALPGMPFMLSGFELFETSPINTGLNFSNELIAKYDANKLPLFSEGVFNWTRRGNMVGAIRYSMHLRKQYAELLSNPDPKTIIMGSSDNPNLLVFARKQGKLTLIFVFNMTLWDFQAGEAELYAKDYIAHGLWGYEGVSLLSERMSVRVELGGAHSMMFKAEDV